MDDKQRIIQEFVPGKQITLSHLIASPTDEIFKKLGLNEQEFSAIGVLTITPSEGAIIAADIATKSSDVHIGFIDRFNGALVITGDVSSVESALTDIMQVMENQMAFTPSPITST